MSPARQRKVRSAHQQLSHCLTEKCRDYSTTSARPNKSSRSTENTPSPSSLSEVAVELNMTRSSRARILVMLPACSNCWVLLKQSAEAKALRFYLGTSLHTCNLLSLPALERDDSSNQNNAPETKRKPFRHTWQSCPCPSWCPRICCTSNTAVARQAFAFIFPLLYLCSGEKCAPLKYLRSERVRSRGRQTIPTHNKC